MYGKVKRGGSFASKINMRVMHFRMESKEGMACGYVLVWVKKKVFWVETFCIYQKMRLHPLSSNI